MIGNKCLCCFFLLFCFIFVFSYFILYGYFSTLHQIYIHVINIPIKEVYGSNFLPFIFLSLTIWAMKRLRSIIFDYYLRWTVKVMLKAYKCKMTINFAYITLSYFMYIKMAISYESFPTAFKTCLSLTNLHR